MKKLAIVASHPVQYNAPWFRILAERRKIQVKVFYTWSQVQNEPLYDPYFKRNITWDIPLLEGYEFEFVENIAKEPGAHHFAGINNPSLNKRIKEWKPHAILVIGWSFKSHLSCMRHFKNKIPVYFRGDSTLLDEVKGPKLLLRRLFLSWVYRNVDMAFHVGTNNKHYFLKHGLKETQLVSALHAIDNNRFSTILNEKNDPEIRHQLGIQPHEFVVLFAGKLETKKNPFFLIELSQKIKDKNIIFLLVGNGHLENELKRRAERDSRIKFLDSQNQTKMPAVYKAANVFILPSKGPGETWGLAANEAMACGLPVVLSDRVGGAVDLIKGNGIIFQKGEIARVQAYIEKLKSDPYQYAQAREASLRHIQNFGFVQIAEAIEKACE